MSGLGNWTFVSFMHVKSIFNTPPPPPFSDTAVAVAASAAASPAAAAPYNSISNSNYSYSNSDDNMLPDFQYNDHVFYFFPTSTASDHHAAHHVTSTVIVMICAWILLIVGFLLCCCIQYTRLPATSNVGGAMAAAAAAAAERRRERRRNGGGRGRGRSRDRTNNAGEPLEICRRFPPDYEVESLPSYTIVSGLPTYDDALEEFRKAGIILTPTAVVPIIKIFEADTKDGAPQLYNSAAHCETTFSIANEQQSPLRASNDNISLSSTCTCGAGSLSNQQPPSQLSSGLALNAAALQPQFIELSPEHLAALSQKRLSLQIAFNGSLRRNSRARVDLRNTLLRSRAGNAVAAATAANERATLDAAALLPPIHRSSSVNSLQHERNLLDQRLQHLHHRGSLC